MNAFEKPSLLFLGDCRSATDAKTAFGIRDWDRDAVVGQHRLEGCEIDLALPELSLAEAVEAGAKSLIVGVASNGGVLPERWTPTLIDALLAGLDVVSGMHTRLRLIPELVAAAQAHGRRLVDIRDFHAPLATGTGVKRAGKRLLTVGTDCALGKKYTALAIARALASAGYRATFRATGQTGIMISGSGIPIDAVVADFISGAAELLTPANEADHWDVVEGQGSLFNPSYAGVTLGLLHGAQPDALVLCHDPVRPHILGHPDFPMPELDEAMDLYVRLARLTNSRVRFVAISMNTSRLDTGDARKLLLATSKRFGLPCVDPLRDGVEPIVAALGAIQ